MSFKNILLAHTGSTAFPSSLTINPCRAIFCAGSLACHAFRATELALTHHAGDELRVAVGLKEPSETALKAVNSKILAWEPIRRNEVQAGRSPSHDAGSMKAGA
mgnify:CR=1 FL=1